MSPNSAHPARDSAPIRLIVRPEELAKYSLLGNDLQRVDRDYKQWRNYPGARTTQPERPADQGKQQSQVHRVATEPKDALSHEVRGLGGIHRVGRGLYLTEAQQCGHNDRDA